MEIGPSNKVLDQLVERILKLGNRRLNTSAGPTKSEEISKKSIESDLVEALEEGVQYLEDSEKETKRRLEMQIIWKRKIKDYSEKIQNLTVKKNLKIPFLIHKETETCVADFCDLTSALSDNVSKNERLTNYYKQSSKVNQKLRQDMDVISNYLLFIDDKLAEISESERNLSEEQKTVTETLNQTRDRMMAAKEKYKLVLAHVDEKRGWMINKENELECKLVQKIKRLAEIKQNKVEEIAKIQKTKSLFSVKTREVENLEKTIVSAKNEKNKRMNELNTAKRNLSRIIKTEQVKRENLDQKQAHLEKTVKHCAEGFQAMETQTKNNEQELDHLKRQDIQINLKIEELARKKAGLQEDIINEEALRTHVDREIETSLLQIEDESSKLLTVLEERDDLQTEYYKSSTNNKSNEESMLREINSLRESLNNTISRKSTLEASINQTQKELKVFIKENEIRTKILRNKHDKYSRLYKEIEKERMDEQIKLDMLQKSVEEIQSQIDKILKDRNEAYDNPHKKLNNLKQNSIELQEKRVHQYGRIEGLKEHIKHIEGEIRELETNVEGMSAITDNIHSQLTKANYQLSNLKEQSEFSEKLLEAQKGRFQTVLDQTSTSEMTHNNNLSELGRKNVEISREINSRLSDNECLAGEFKRLNLDIFERKISAGEFYGPLFELIQFDHLIEEIKCIVRQWVSDLDELSEFNVADLGSRLSKMITNTVKNDINMQYFMNNISEESNDLFRYMKDELEAALSRGHC